MLRQPPRIPAAGRGVRLEVEQRPPAEAGARPAGDEPRERDPRALERGRGVRGGQGRGLGELGGEFGGEQGELRGCEGGDVGWRGHGRGGAAGSFQPKSGISIGSPLAAVSTLHQMGLLLCGSLK